MSEQRLRIVHVLRAPVGGLFRHVIDLAAAQAALGHEVGVIADSSTGGECAARAFAAIAPRLALGVARFPMRREPHPADIAGLWRVYRHVRRLKPDVLHGHGSKGGFFTRANAVLPGLAGVARAYTPHGGSFHRQPGYALHLCVERLVAAQTDVMFFESDYIAGQVAEGVGPTRALTRVAKNGLRPEEFAPVALRPDAADFVYIGELSRYKGVDTLIDALALIHAGDWIAPRAARSCPRPAQKPNLVIVGSGKELDALAAQVDRCGLNRHVAFYGELPAREAFALGRIVVAPSRAESLPYIVLETLAAEKPLIATDVGGVGEIFGPHRDRLIPRDRADLLAGAMLAALDRSPDALAAESLALKTYVAQHFSVDAMVRDVLAGYREALARKRAP
ncbi:glycosyltransferase involved in cell wall biosynthesis [Rhodoblastus acidophilus]|nr:glycosyltransferase involved in cell wall biosynthesis [Rhodoblastus acidophilus]MCW2332829.1 glycosyltransferase involved in cell wall biosynthesis [Rhodoblastus acidophilus]